MVGRGLELTMAALRLCDAPADAPTWDDVVAEIITSCRQRAPRGALLDVPGAVGVLAGPAPVVWAYAESAAAVVVAATDESVVEEIYVGDARLAGELSTHGWVLDSRVSQVVMPAIPVSAAGGTAIEIAELGREDLADVRAGLVDWGRCAPAIIEAAYPDEFFTVAAPVTLLGARHDHALCGIVGVRRQTRASMLFALAVAPSHRQAHIGRRLVTQAVEHARGDGAQFVHAQTNDVSAAVLARCGFAAVGSWRRLVRAA